MRLTLQRQSINITKIVILVDKKSSFTRFYKAVSFEIWFSRIAMVSFWRSIVSWSISIVHISFSILSDCFNPSASNEPSYFFRNMFPLSLRSHSDESSENDESSAITVSRERPRLPISWLFKVVCSTPIDAASVLLDIAQYSLNSLIRVRIESLVQLSIVLITLKF